MKKLSIKIILILFISMLISIIIFQAHIISKSEDVRIEILEDYFSTNNQAKDFLSINSYQKEGDAYYFYDKAFEKYIMTMDEYDKIRQGKKIIFDFPLIDKNNFKVIDMPISEISFILEGSKNKKFNGWRYYEKVGDVNNLLFVYQNFTKYLFELLNDQIDKNAESFWPIAKTIYCFVDHFENNYPAITSSINYKKDLFRIIAEYYISKGQIREYQKSSQILEKYIIDSEHINYLWSSLSISDFLIKKKIFASDNYPFANSLLHIIYYEKNIKNLSEIAEYSRMRFIQFESIKALGILQNYYWRPLEAYDSSKKINALINSKDSITASMVIQAKKISLSSTFWHLFTLSKALTAKDYVTYDSIKPLIKKDQK